MAGYGSLTRDEEVGQRPPRNVPLRTVLPLLAVSVLAIAAVCLAVSSSVSGRCARGFVALLAVLGAVSASVDHFYFSLW